jgi:hypothetical protein
LPQQGVEHRLTLFAVVGPPVEPELGHGGSR